MKVVSTSRKSMMMTVFCIHVRRQHHFIHWIFFSYWNSIVGFTLLEHLEKCYKLSQRTRIEIFDLILRLISALLLKLLFSIERNWSDLAIKKKIINVAECSWSLPSEMPLIVDRQSKVTGKLKELKLKVQEFIQKVVDSFAFVCGI